MELMFVVIWEKIPSHILLLLLQTRLLRLLAFIVGMKKQSVVLKEQVNLFPC